MLKAQARKKVAPAKLSDSLPSSLNDRLLTAAVEVFLEKGFAAASVDEIAARARASKITFYNHYGNKEALFEAVIRRQNTALLATMSGKIAQDMPLEDFLTGFAHRLHAAFLDNNVVKLVRVLHAEAQRFPQLANVFDQAGPSHAIKMLALELERHMTNGSLRRADPELAAEHFLHLAVGELTRRVLLGVRPAASKAEISRRIAAGIDVFLRAYRLIGRASLLLAETVKGRRAKLHEKRKQSDQRVCIRRPCCCADERALLYGNGFLVR